VPKTRDVPQTPNTKPQAPAPQPSPKNETQPEQPKPKELTGDTRLAKLETAPEKTEDKPERPRTVREALAQQMALRPSRAMQQDGGVSKRLAISSLDSKATAFGLYDEAIVDSVSQCWYDYLARNSYAYDRMGKVVVTFRLHSDGRVTDVKVEEDTVDDKSAGIWAYLCQASVDKAAPFAPWPSDLVHLNKTNYRDIRFQFNY
jgi:outer membrane biosynthesis protein TonB